MERFIIGRSRSGKVVTSEPQQDDLESAEELFDAIVMMSVVASRQRRKFGEIDSVIELVAKVDYLSQRLASIGSFENEMAIVGARTSLDLLKLVQPLLATEFRD